MTIVGTRPEIIKLARIVPEIERHMKHILVHTGQNYDYELNEIFFKDLEMKKPDYFLDAAGENAAQTIGNVIFKADKIMEQERPEALLLYGDTNSALSVIAAKRRKIPIFHMEAGNRCFDQRVPEELNRKVVDHLSDINMVHCEHSRRYLIAEGIRPETIIKTGSPMKEVLAFYKDKIQESQVLKTLGLQPEKFFIVSAHREENIDSEENFNNLLDTLNSLAQKYNERIIVSTHPRTRKRMESLPTRVFNKNIEFLKPLGFYDYNKLQLHAHCAISDSGTITEESSLLGFPAIMIRQAHERPEGMDVGCVIMSGLTKDRVIDSIEIAVSHQLKVAIPDYQVDDVSKHVVRIIQSYTDYVNRVIWHK